MKIIMRDIRKSFGEADVVDIKGDIVFESGKVTTLLGPSGCGKTTLLRMTAGLETPDNGEIYFDDTCVYSHHKGINIPPEKRKLGFVFQDFALWPHLTVFENVAFGLRAQNVKENIRERVDSALRAVKLKGLEGRYPHEMSGGQQQRVAFARAIVIKPQCILFDEPLSALDAVLRDEMRTELKSLVEDLKITAVFVTHDQTEAISMSDRIIVMNKGKAEQIGTPEEIYSKPSSTFVAKFVGKSNWIGNDRMFRPESLFFSKIENSSKYNMNIKTIQFTGTGYELLLEDDERKWFAITGTKPTDKKIDVYVKNDSILHFAD